MIMISHLKGSLSSLSPAENPSTGFLLSSFSCFISSNLALSMLTVERVPGHRVLKGQGARCCCCASAFLSGHRRIAEDTLVAKRDL